jgi:hypothetical protein
MLLDRLRLSLPGDPPDEAEPVVTAVHDPQLEQRIRRHETERRQAVASQPAPRSSPTREPYGYD